MSDEFPFRVGQAPKLIDTYINPVVVKSHGDTHTGISKAGLRPSAREVLDEQLSASKAYGSENLANTHGESFHKDVHESFKTNLEVKEAGIQSDNEEKKGKQKEKIDPNEYGKSKKSVDSALNDLIKAEKKDDDGDDDGDDDEREEEPVDEQQQEVEKEEAKGRIGKEDYQIDEEKSLSAALDNLMKTGQEEFPYFKSDEKLIEEAINEEIASREEIYKAGEGSRGGVVVGHTSSGAPIYGSSAATQIHHVNHAREMTEAGKVYTQQGKVPYDTEAVHVYNQHTDGNVEGDESKNRHYAGHVAPDGNGAWRARVTHSQFPATFENKDKAIEFISNSHKRYRDKEAARNAAQSASGQPIAASEGDVLGDLVKAIQKADIWPDGHLPHSGFAGKAPPPVAHGGEGSRGGKIIGHTKSGKPIYSDHLHPSHASFTHDDHMDASLAHKKNVGTFNPIARKHHSDQRAQQLGAMTYHAMKSENMSDEDIAKLIGGGNLHENSDSVRTKKREPEMKSELSQLADQIKKGKDDKVSEVMREFKAGTLRSGSKKGSTVTSREQAIAIAMSESGQARKSHPMIKAQGKGGVWFDFGGATGNPIADNYNRILGRHTEPIQEQTAVYQNQQTEKAMYEYIEKGEDQYMSEHGNDVNVMGANERIDAIDAINTSVQAPQGVQKAVERPEMQLGGDTIKAMSETDAAVLESARHLEMLNKSEPGETIPDMRGGGVPQGAVVVIDSMTGQAFDVVSGEEIISPS